MFDYLQQFNSLPKDLRDKVSSPSAMAVLSELESKYRIDLAMTVMKVMIKSLAVKNLPAYFVSEEGLNGDQAEALTKELKEKIFSAAIDHLGLMSEMRALDLEKDIAILIKETGLILPSENLISRFKNILATYLKGIRNKIDTRATLAKDIKVGGLGLDQAAIERVFKVCETQKFKSLSVSLPTPPAPPTSRLDKIILSAEKTKAPVAEYNLKQAIASGQVKRLPEPEKQLDLPKPETKVEPAPTVIKPIAPVVPTPAAPSSAPIIKPIVPPVPPVSSLQIPKSATLVTPVKPSVATPTPTPKVTPPPAPAPRPVISRPVAPASPAKPKLHDIKPMPKVMGPVEELQFLDLVNFRRLGKTPQEITAKVFGKIKLLEKEGYDKMVAGIKAWRQSPVNRLYLRLGQEAMVKGLKIKEASEARQKANQEYLSMEEIEAVVNLNSKLVF